MLAALSAAIAHRGPDGEGRYVAPGVALIHRRLAIIDLEGGDQPIGNEEGSIQVILNGEIYNYQSLRNELENKGHRFRTKSDTEVIAHGYEEEGERIVERLRGMFAIAIWDGRQRRLVLARDRVGIKPLYIYRDAEKLLFGSELKAILAYPGKERRIDPEALESYLAYGMVTGSRTIFRGIEKLPPAHLLVVTPENLLAAPKRYWQLQIEPDESKSVDDWGDAIRTKVEEAVRGHLIADVPVGAFLSGGIDSSIITGLAAKQTGKPLHTFSIGFGDEKFNELPYAREIARQFGTQHHEEIVTPDAARLVEELTHHFDEPFADASAIPTYLVSRLAKQHVKVVLSGDGGDEAFGGYARYAHDLKEARWRNRLPQWMRKNVLGPLGKAWPKADWLPRALRAKTLLTNLSREPAAAYANTLSQCRPPWRRGLLAPDVRAVLNGQDPERCIREAYRSAPIDDPLAGMIAADTAVMLPDDYLVKVDRASMAHGLEVRPPLLDHEVLELAARIPSALKVRHGETKWIFKEAYRDLLPMGIRQRPKQGFDVPVDTWLRGPLREVLESTVLSSNAVVSSLIDQSQARRLCREHQNKIGRHGQILWSLLILARWAERYLQARIPSTAEA